MTVTSIRTHTEQIFQFHSMQYNHILEEFIGDQSDSRHYVSGTNIVFKTTFVRDPATSKYKPNARS